MLAETYWPKPPTPGCSNAEGIAKLSLENILTESFTISCCCLIMFRLLITPGYYLVVAFFRKERSLMLGDLTPASKCSCPLLRGGDGEKILGCINLASSKSAISCFLPQPRKSYANLSALCLNSGIAV